MKSKLILISINLKKKLIKELLKYNEIKIIYIKELKVKININKTFFYCCL